jgi:hypothetical protein
MLVVYADACSQRETVRGLCMHCAAQGDLHHQCDCTVSHITVELAMSQPDQAPGRTYMRVSAGSARSRPDLAAAGSTSNRPGLRDLKTTVRPSALTPSVSALLYSVQQAGPHPHHPAMPCHVICYSLLGRCLNAQTIPDVACLSSAPPCRLSFQAGGHACEQPGARPGGAVCRYEQQEGASGQRVHARLHEPSAQASGPRPGALLQLHYHALAA